MAYSKSLDTKKTIIAACRKMFYEQGFDAVTYAQISKESGVLPGTILYHYKNLLEIASVIITEDRTELTEAVCRKMRKKEQDMEVNLVVHLIHLKIFFEDERYRRFHTEAELGFSQKKNAEGYPTMNLGFYREEFCKRNPEEKEALAVDFYYNASIGAGGHINQFISSHIHEMTLEQAFRYCMDIYYCMFHYSSEELKKLLDGAWAVVARLQVSNDELKIKIQG